MSDWNDIKRPFRDALIAAFNWDKLALVLVYHCDQRLDLITSENAGFEKNVDDVIAHAEQNGWLERLAQGAQAENETHTGLQATVPQILRGVTAEGKIYYQRPAAGGRSGQAGAGAGAQAGDITTVGNISNVAGVAIGAGAQAQVFQGDVHYHYETPAEQEKPRLEYEPEMVAVPAGVFLMGSEAAEGIPANESSTFEWELAGFRMALQPVTNYEYYEYICHNEEIVPPDALGWEEGIRPSYEQQEEPVRGVTWHEALAYCQWLAEETKRPYALPSEAQWERAARLEGDPLGMVGQNLEWTSTVWGDDWREPDRSSRYPWHRHDRRREDLNATDQMRRVTRGGSTRPTERSSELPAQRGLMDIGFRVVVNEED